MSTTRQVERFQDCVRRCAVALRRDARSIDRTRTAAEAATGTGPTTRTRRAGHVARGVERRGSAVAASSPRRRSGGGHAHARVRLRVRLARGEPCVPGDPSPAPAAAAAAPDTAVGTGQTRHHGRVHGRRSTGDVGGRTPVRRAGPCAAANRHGTAHAPRNHRSPVPPVVPVPRRACVEACGRDTTRTGRGPIATRDQGPDTHPHTQTHARHGP